jgi:hypothetical protein
VSIDIADRKGGLFLFPLRSAERFRDRAMRFGSAQVKTRGASARAWLSRVTLADQRRGRLLRVLRVRGAREARDRARMALGFLERPERLRLRFGMAPIRTQGSGQAEWARCRRVARWLEKSKKLSKSSL